MLEGVTGLGAMLPTSGLMVLHVTLSALVTAHVLLRKREIGAAIGWIGLSWLSPFLGSALYYLFGINRVRQRARALGRPNLGLDNGRGTYAGRNQDPLFQALDRTAFRLSRRRAVSGNLVALLRNGDEAYPRM